MTLTLNISSVWAGDMLHPNTKYRLPNSKNPKRQISSGLFVDMGERRVALHRRRASTEEAAEQECAYTLQVIGGGDGDGDGDGDGGDYFGIQKFYK